MAGALTAATATGGVFVAQSASAGTPPTGPGNIEVFPERDMVAVEGYAAQAGQTATVTVKRGGQVIGVGSRVLDSTGFMELNHDADGCFKDVTPAIEAGDTVEVSFSGSPLVDSMTVNSAKITEITASDPTAGNTNSVTIKGSYGSEVNLDRFAVEVVNPAMRDAGAIGERAIGWSPNEVPDEAPVGYTVSGTAANGGFEVTFANMSQEDQQMVFDGQAVALSWMADRTDGVEQQLGLTLAEEGLTGGGAPGCPAGPDGAKPPKSDYTVTWTSETEATVTWATATPVAGAAAVTGYSVAAVDQAANAGGAFRQTGYQTGAGATQVVLDGLTADAVYDIQVRSVVAGDEMSAPFALAGTVTPGTGGGDGGTGGDTTAPVLTATPAFNGTTAVIADSRTLTLAADEGTIYYTVDGSAVTSQPNGNVPSATAKIYQEPIPITAADTKVNVVVIDAAGNATHSSGVVSPKAAAAAVAPTGLTVLGVTGAGPDAAAPKGTISVGWNPVTDATEYRVRVFDQTVGSTSPPVLLSQYDTVVTGATNATVSGLPKSAANHRYVVRVQAKTPASPNFGPTTIGNTVYGVVPGDDIGVEVALYRTGDELRIRGTGTVPGSVITAHRSNAAGTGPVTNAVPGYPTATVGALDAGLPTGAWEIVVDPAPTTNPGTLWFKSSNGDVFGPVTVETK
ncbi:hypothetical protein GCU56_10800 [Geodermatophilus sabuli]|uniref:Fibronectin type-III domain-containing protein n=1 Tax=Geodermatophilus sabuli TaxID=1564158 RepID=A0A7K3W0F4_9ACTN|nr:fibronectin type III domain-containing protein [Geodermatophilus sabuli]NEK58359.1 hypothetical protein [Geodermatophilus sabuli]